MKRHITTLLCVLILVALALTGCGDKDTHQHTYGVEWQKNETNHWHSATCKDGDDCASAKASEGAHADADNNKVCDVCGYDYGHTHSHATELSSDKTGHWYAVSCGCAIDVKDKAAHTDANNDGACDICKFDDGHEHAYETAWSMDAENHWHAASCGHSVVADEEEHDFDDVGVCATCGYIEGETISVEKAVEMGAFYDSNVKGGVVVYAYDTYGSIITSTSAYTLGNKAIKFETVDNYGTQTVRYLSKLANGMFVVEEEYANGELVGARRPDGDFGDSDLDGYLFRDVISGDINNPYQYYGVKALIEGLYDLGKQSGTMVEMIVNTDGEISYRFTYTTAPMDEYVSWQGDHTAKIYNIDVVFTLSDRYTYESVAIVYDCYDAVGTDEDGDGTFEYAPTNLYPSAVHNYVIAQETGDRGFEAKYDPEKVLVKDFKIVDPATGTEYTGDTIKISKNYNLFNIVATAPADANIDLDKFALNGESFMGYLTIEKGNHAIGDKFEITVSSLLTSKTYIVEVIVPPVTEITPTVGGSETTNKVLTLTDNKAEATIGAVVNSGADGAYTATLVGEGATLTANGDGTYKFVAEGEGSWTITVVSTSKPEITAELVITTVTPKPSTGEVEGKYTATDEYGYITTFEFADGKVTVVDDIAWAWNGTFDYTVDAAGNITVDTTAFEIVLEGGKYYVNGLGSSAGYFGYELVKEGGSGSETPEGQIPSGKYEVSFMGQLQYTITVDGTTLTIVGAESDLNDGTYTYVPYDDISYDINDMDGNYTYWYIVDYNGELFISIGMGGEKPMVLVEGSGGGDTPNVPEKPELPELVGNWGVKLENGTIYFTFKDDGMLIVSGGNYAGVYSWTCETFEWWGMTQTVITIMNGDEYALFSINVNQTGDGYIYLDESWTSYDLIEIDPADAPALPEDKVDVQETIESAYEWRFDEYYMYFLPEGGSKLTTDALGDEAGYEFEYYVYDNEIIIVFVENSGVPAEFENASYKYDEATNTIIATFLDGTTAEFVFGAHPWVG